MDSDLILIHRIRAGDEAAIEAFVRKYYAKVLSYCEYRLQDVQQAEDLTQETFYRFFRAFETYNHRGKLVNYLYSIAGNLCRDYWKVEQKIQKVELTETIKNMPVECDVTEKMDIETAVMELPKEIREVIWMHFFLGMKLEEISEAEGISLPLVKYRLKRGRSLLKGILGKEDL
ncbi:RNA polymerase sigma factor [Butyrivibrio sp. INlla16]|uniref:RNA polymerase sigma factor n=1 Tax=Butyrivibrio sp. INlla16 TaxID=1520807 RepID=UPI0008815378|nr:RNA polymerase sigma factor [Butyrivibrio sp. INlla16]SDB69639.1 RNA polymerase sigma-70 factor, ECF subfamily [Butyrivibrio sp. INlla16]